MIFTQNLKVAQISAESIYLNQNFSAWNEIFLGSWICFYFSCSTSSKWEMIFYSASPPFLQKNFEFAQIIPEKYLSELKFSHDHEFDFFPVACQVTEKLIFNLDHPIFVHKIWNLFKFLRKHLSKPKFSQDDLKIASAISKRHLPVNKIFSESWICLYFSCSTSDEIEMNFYSSASTISPQNLEVA